MHSLKIEDLKTTEVQKILTSAISPRPIALVSSIDKKGNINLAPFSFFNAIGANPATLVFSPALRGRDAMSKNTLDNIREVAEVVIHVVTFDMVEKVNIAGMEYSKDVNEFLKAGFTAIAADRVKPPRIKESPVQFECVVKEIIETGREGGAGNIVRCEVLKVHLSDDILDENGNIDEWKLDLVGRMGSDHYVRTRKGIFEVKKPGTKVGIGFDSLPDFIVNTEYLTANQLAKMACVEFIPEPTSDFLDKSLNSLQPKILSERKIFKIAKKLIKEDNPKDALLLLLKYGVY